MTNTHICTSLTTYPNSSTTVTHTLHNHTTLLAHTQTGEERRGEERRGEERKGEESRWGVEGESIRKSIL
jgi:hypothetical protein